MWDRLGTPGAADTGYRLRRQDRVKSGHKNGTLTETVYQATLMNLVCFWPAGRKQNLPL